jgi:hypothetical protein
MPTRPLLPSSLPQAFTVAQAADAGVAPGRLRGRQLSRPFHGVRVRGHLDVGSLDNACRALAPRLRDGQFFSHETALYLVGAAMPEWPYRPAVHVSSHRPAREPRTRGVVGHRLQTREPATITVDGLPVEHPVRAWRQAGRTWTRDDLVAAADSLVSGKTAWCSVDDLGAEVVRMGDGRSGILTSALYDVRVGVRSPRETRLRLLMTAAGLPEPHVAWNVFDSRGTFVAELDLAYPRYRVAVEYDGRIHAQDERQFAKDADRWAAIHREGWHLVRILSHHLADDGRAAVALVREALLQAHWTPGR